jgi:hypothetical protein
MVNEIRYYDTAYTFVNPVRHFKANDPYYFEVDNIPIKQLEESQRFLKDQVDGIISRQNNKKDIEIDRSGFSELRPYATGNDRKVRVKPGKYTSRINNAYDLTPLQVIQQVGGWSNTVNSNGTISDLNTWRVQTNIGSVSAVLAEFQDGLNGDALNMNGLAERAFVFPIDDEDGVSYPQGTELLNVSAPGYSQLDSDFDPDDRPLYPNYIGAILKHTTVDTTRDLTLIRNVYTPGEIPSGSNQGRIESEFIKRWRGAIRTSVVDVPEELEITIPDFDSADFFFVDADGNQNPLNANHRIDLLFIYSKAVDEESTTIPKFDSNGNPTRLTQPTLGILKGAGVGISRQTSTNNNNADDRVDLQDLNGVPIMLAHPGDENGTNNGFTTSAGVIRGSFPSPDDLMNLAPVLSENLETNAFPLIGQSILPVAYIRVQTPGGPIADLITNEDIIDIRPFFRTAELAYNERAGIAAATPQVSIANPVVTEAHLEKVRKEVYSDLRNRIDSIGSSTPAPTVAATAGTSNGTRVIAAGNVCGGYWGPEGALIKHAKTSTAGGITNATMNQFVDLVESEFGYPAGSVPYLPDWDKALWYTEGEYTGDAICDHINVGLPGMGEYGGAGGHAKYMPPWIGGLDEGQTRNIEYIRDIYGFDRFAMYGWGDSGDITLGSKGRLTVNTGVLDNRNVQINFVRKRIKLNLDNTPWVNDYHVNVKLLHCIPLSDIRGGADQAIRSSNGVWVQKYKDYFVICVAWAGTPLDSGDVKPWASRNSAERWAGFAQPQMQLIGGGDWATYGCDAAGYSQGLQPEPRRDSFNNLLNRTRVSQFSTQAIEPTDPKYTQPSYLNPVVPLVYPSVQWEVVGIDGSMIQESFGSNGAKMRGNDPTITCR